MEQNASFRTILLLMAMVLVIFACSDNGNQMEKTRNSLGEPDDKIVNDMGTFKSEIWVYARSDRNYIYRFEKSASSCGGSSDWTLVPGFSYASSYGYQLYNPPPTITHTPIEAAAPNKAIKISAKVELHKPVKNSFIYPDEQIIEVNLGYRACGDSLFYRIKMSNVDSLYVEEIPYNVVTSAGVDYFIEATSDESTWGKYSKIPIKEHYTIEISDSVTSVQKAAYTDSSEDPFSDNLPFDPETIAGRYSPMSP